MKNLFLLTAVLFISLSFTSCQKEEIIINTGIQVVDKDHPLPAELSENTFECWITNESILKAKEISFNCESNFNQNTGQWDNYNCGMWRTLEVQEYYGTFKDTRYISAKNFKVVVDQDTFYAARDLSDKVGSIKGFFGSDGNPVNVNSMRLWGINHL